MTRGLEGVSYGCTHSRRVGLGVEKRLAEAGRPRSGVARTLHTRPAVPSEVFRALQRAGPPTVLGRAIGEIGRIARTHRYPRLRHRPRPAPPDPHSAQPARSRPRPRPSRVPRPSRSATRRWTVSRSRARTPTLGVNAHHDIGTGEVADLRVERAGRAPPCQVTCDLSCPGVARQIEVGSRTSTT